MFLEAFGGDQLVQDVAQNIAALRQAMQPSPGALRPSPSSAPLPEPLHVNREANDVAQAQTAGQPPLQVDSEHCEHSRTPQPMPAPSAPSKKEQVKNMWRGRQEALESTVCRLYEAHSRADPRNTTALRDLFLDLPADWPVGPRNYGLTEDDVVEVELEQMEERIQEVGNLTASVSDACNTPLNVVKLMPFFAAVLCRFAEEAGIAREYVFGFLSTLTGWPGP